MNQFIILKERRQQTRDLGLCAGGNTGFLLIEETLKHKHLANTDHKQDDGLPNGPNVHTLIQIFSPESVLSLSKTIPGLRVWNHFQDLMDRQAGRLHLHDLFRGSYQMHICRVHAVCECIVLVFHLCESCRSVHVRQ